MVTVYITNGEKKYFLSISASKFQPPPLTNKAPWMSKVPVPLFQLIEHCKLCKYIYNMSRLLTISCRNVVYLQHVLFADHQLQECWSNESNDTVWWGGGGGTPAAGYYVLTTKTISKQQCQIIVHLNAKCLITVTKVTAATTYNYSLVYKLFL